MHTIYLIYLVYSSPYRAPNPNITDLFKKSLTRQIGTKYLLKINSTSPVPAFGNFTHHDVLAYLTIPHIGINKRIGIPSNINTKTSTYLSIISFLLNILHNYSSQNNSSARSGKLS